MENFQDFDRPHAPQKTIGDIISHAFDMYKGVFVYALVAMVFYFLAAFLVQALSGFDSRTFSEEIRSSDGDFSSFNVWGLPGIKLYYGLSGLLGILFSPIYVGLIYMANKYNYKQPVQFSDLFIGYRQNFVNIIIYNLISTIIIAIAFMLCVLPGFFVLPFFLLGYPVLLFENASFSEALSKTFTIAKDNYGVFLGCAILGFLISISGIILCFIGIVASMPFIFMVMYSVYCAFCGSPRALSNQE